MAARDFLDYLVSNEIEKENYNSSIKGILQTVLAEKTDAIIKNYMKRDSSNVFFEASKNLRERLGEIEFGESSIPLFQRHFDIEKYTCDFYDVVVYQNDKPITKSSFFRPSFGISYIPQTKTELNEFLQNVNKNIRSRGTIMVILLMLKKLKEIEKVKR